jgi:hypothetical protein
MANRKLKIGEVGRFENLPDGAYFRLSLYPGDVIYKLNNDSAYWFADNYPSSGVVWAKSPELDPDNDFGPVCRIPRPTCRALRRLYAMLKQEVKP